MSDPPPAIAFSRTGFSRAGCYDRNPPIPAGVKLVPDSATGYAVSLNGVPIGQAIRDTRPPFRSWAFRNDERGWYGTVSTQKQAIAALVELHTRKA